MILDEIDPKALRRLIDRHAAVDSFDRRAVFQAALAWRARHDGKPYSAALVAPVDDLFVRWYDSLLAGQPDYTVYGSPFYLADLWTCWRTYSRSYIRSVTKAEHGGALDLGEVRRILDLGCGFGYTTAAWREAFPGATVYGTNLAGTTQWEVASRLGAEYGFSVVDETTFPADVDLAFASEFFEHLEDPFAYLTRLLDEARPRYLVVASSFAPAAIGHFNRYVHAGEVYTGAHASRYFGDVMRAAGYERSPVRFWNDRPAIWVRPT